MPMAIFVDAKKKTNVGLVPSRLVFSALLIPCSVIVHKSHDCAVAKRSVAMGTDRLRQMWLSIRMPRVEGEQHKLDS